MIDHTWAVVCHDSNNVLGEYETKEDAQSLVDRLEGNVTIHRVWPYQPSDPEPPEITGPK